MVTNFQGKTFDEVERLFEGVLVARKRIAVVAATRRWILTASRRSAEPVLVACPVAYGDGLAMLLDQVRREKWKDGLSTAEMLHRAAAAEQSNLLRFREKVRLVHVVAALRWSVQFAAMADRAVGDTDAHRALHSVAAGAARCARHCVELVDVADEGVRSAVIRSHGADLAQTIAREADALPRDDSAIC